MIRKLLDKVTTRLAAWHHRYLNAVDFIYIVAMLIGLLTGASAALLKRMIDFLQRLIFSYSVIHRGNIYFLLLPVIGIMLATLYTRYIAKNPLEHGSDRIRRDLAQGQSNLSPRLIPGPIVACTFTLGMGGSAGAEDPIAYSGAAIGNNVGKAFKLDVDQLAQLTGCGAAAGIAGIFMAPIGGVMFALEVLKMKQSLQTIMAVILSSLIAALTCYLLLGSHYDVTFMPKMLFDNSLIPWVLGCGVLCGLYSVYYSGILSWCLGLWQNRLRNMWVRALCGGVFVALCLFLFPCLYGEGYDMVSRLMVDDPLDIVAYGPLYHLGLNYNMLLIFMVVLLLVKPWATSATNDSGGVGGDFTPTFFCGAVVGFFFAAFFNHVMGAHLSYSLFAFFGMAAVMAGAIRAPLMAIFIASEMTGLYGFILPLTLAALTSYFTTLLLTRVHTALPFLPHCKNCGNKQTPAQTPTPAPSEAQASTPSEAPKSNT